MNKGIVIVSVIAVVAIAAAIGYSAMHQSCDVDTVKENVTTGDFIEFEVEDKENGKVDKYTMRYLVEEVTADGLKVKILKNGERFDEDLMSVDEFKQLIVPSEQDLGGYEYQSKKVVNTPFGKRECKVYVNILIDDKMYIADNGVCYSKYSEVSIGQDSRIITTDLKATSMFVKA